MSIARNPAGVLVALDPDKNNSNEVKKLRGHYRRQYNETARDGLWGTAAGSCGMRTMWRSEDGHVRIIPCLCCQWGCSMCGVMRAAWFKRELKLAVDRESLSHFWTLTIWTQTMLPQASDEKITGFWNNLRTKLSKYFGKTDFVWIREHTQKGYAHLHLLSDLPISAAELSDLWRESSGGSYIVSAEPVESERAADYLAKYCTQEATARRLPGNEHLKGKRLFSKSRNITFAPFRPPGQKVEHLDEESGEISLRSVWKILQVPYWTEHSRLKMAHGPPIVERVIGQPGATFDTSRLELAPDTAPRGAYTA